MFARVIYGATNEMLINPNCYIRLIYEYIKIKADVPNEVEIDLCDGKGFLRKISEPPTYRSGLELLEPGETYYLVALKPDRKLRMVATPLIDSSSAIYELLVKKLDPKTSFKYFQMGIHGNRRSQPQGDVVVLTDVVKKKKKKKELKQSKSSKLPSYTNQEIKQVAYITPAKQTLHKDGKKVVNDVKHSKDSKSNETVLLAAGKNIWYLNPSSTCLRDIDQGKQTQIKK